MGIKLEPRKPGIMDKIARDFALRKAGIDPRTPEERAEDDREMREGVRSYDKNHREWFGEE